jgi:hypothetical protein
MSRSSSITGKINGMPCTRRKARVFASVGITGAEAEELRDAILLTARDAEARLGVANEHGQRYIVDFDFVRYERIVRTRSTWIVRADEGLPRLTSCYVLEMRWCLWLALRCIRSSRYSKTCRSTV